MNAWFVSAATKRMYGMQAQILTLVGCIAESNNLKRRERTMLITEIENDLKMMH